METERLALWSSPVPLHIFKGCCGGSCRCSVSQGSEERGITPTTSSWPRRQAVSVPFSISRTSTLGWVSHGDPRDLCYMAFPRYERLWSSFSNSQDSQLLRFALRDWGNTLHLPMKGVTTWLINRTKGFSMLLAPRVAHVTPRSRHHLTCSDLTLNTIFRVHLKVGFVRNLAKLTLSPPRPWHIF